MSSKCTIEGNYAIHGYTPDLTKVTTDWKSKEEYQKVFQEVYEYNIKKMEQPTSLFDPADLVDTRSTAVVQSVETKQDNLRIQIEKKMGGPVFGTVMEHTYISTDARGALHEGSKKTAIKALTGITRVEGYGYKLKGKSTDTGKGWKATVDYDFQVSGKGKSYKGLKYTLDSDAKEFFKSRLEASPEERAVHIENLRRNDKGDVKFANKGSKNSYKDESLKGYKKVYDATFNDIRSVKKLVKSLNDESDNKLSAEQVKHLNSILDIYVDRASSIMPEIKIKLNSKGDINFGAFVPYGKKRGIYVSTSEGDNVGHSAQNPAERLVHEIVHAATYYAIESKDSKVANVLTRGQRLHEQVVKQITWKDLITENSENTSKEDERAAKEMLEHLKGRDGFHEFIALGLTNEKLISKLKTLEVTPGKFKDATNMLEALKFLFLDIMNIILDIVRREPKGQKAYELMAKLTVELASANNRAIRTQEKATLSGKLGGKRDQINEYLSTKMSEYEKATGKKPFPPKPINGTALQNGVWIAKNLWRFYNDPSTRPYYEGALSSVGLHPEGVFRQLLDAVSQDDDFKKKVETLGLLSTGIDAKREELATVTTNMLVSAFTDKLSRSDNVALKEVILDTDLQSLLADYSQEEVMQLLSDSEYASEEVRKKYVKLKKLISADKYSSTVSQIKGLAGFMVHGKTTVKKQMLNATNITNLAGKPKKHKAEVSTLIDQIASLEAIEVLDNEYKGKVNDLYAKESEGVINMLEMHRAFVVQTKKELFDRDSKVSNMIKGYTKDVFDEDISLKVDLASKEKELNKDGWDLVNKLNSDKNVVTDQYAVYVNKMGVIQNYNKQAIRTTDTKRSGTSLTELERARGLKETDVERRVRATLKKFPDGIPGMIPVFSASGKVIDYRYMMTKERKRTLMKQDRRATYSLGRMYATTLDKKASNDMNRQVIKALVEDAKENYTKTSHYGNNGKEYILISAASEDPKYREFYRILPTETRIEMNKKFPDGIPVRRDLVRAFFGERSWTIANLGVLQNAPRALTSSLKLAESVWKDLVKIAKVDIIIKTPAVLVSNVVSNIMLTVQFGVSPKEAIALQFKGYHALKDYQSSHKKVLEVTELLRMAKLKNKNTKSLELQLERLQAELKRNSAAPLIDRGMFTTIVEDIHPEDTKAGSKIVRKFEDKLERVPEFVKVAGNWLFLTEKTPVYKTLLRATQTSDFLARYAMYHAGTQKDIKSIESGSGKRATKKDVEGIQNKWADTALMAFLNYNVRGSTAIEYAEDMGLIMFTKFFIGVQKVIKVGLRDHPVDFALVAGLQTVLNTDVDDVVDASWWNKNYGYIAHSPTDVLTHVLTPTLFELPELTKDAIANGIIQ